jgi:UDP-N-acetylglucosamine/UDP-N-acetyl-alpha-D-glucosaminouronate 4-epimerase
MKILVTGAAGFIGSNIVDALLDDSRVEFIRILDNLATGTLENIKHLKGNKKVEFIEGDIRNIDTCNNVCEGMDLVDHQAALGSVPRSIKDPLITNDVNITGTLNIFSAARDNGIKRVVYAASSSTYGDHPGLPKVEDVIGKPLSPYAFTKYVNELYAEIYGSLFNMQMIGLRYFNVFGPRQNPQGPYAAVIPLFVKSIMENEAPVINGDGSHTRDFTYVDNAVQSNIKALFTTNEKAANQVYNIAYGKKTSLLELFNYLKEVSGSKLEPNHGPERIGDVKHSLADISKAKKLLDYDPKISVEEGLKKTFDWYKKSKKIQAPKSQSI